MKSLHQSRSFRLAGSLLAQGGMAALVAASLSLAACESTSSNRPKAEARPTVERDAPLLLRNTIGAEAIIQGADPTLLTGYGIVVGLRGTGAGDAPPAIRALLEREMTLRGVGAESSSMGDISPRRMLDDPNNCAVLVTATVAPGAPKGSTFDVLVTTLPGSAATSLEGGRLWTTDLRPGVQDPNGATARILAKARGPIFINPYATPGSTDARGAINATTGRVIGGGTMTSPLEMLVAMDNPSHSRSRAIANAINARFPQLPGDRELAAKGRNEDSVALIVPARWRDDAAEFVQLVRHLRIDQSFPQQWAARFVKALEEEPYLSAELSWCLQAVGPAAIPALQTAYDSGEIVARLAALRAGARLGDITTAQRLGAIAREGPMPQRLSAIELLADLPDDPLVNLALRELVDSPEAPVRIGAYEALARRTDPTLDRVRIGDKFVLDIVPAKEPMIYVSQQGEPRIAILGAPDAVVVDRPTLIVAWDSTLMLAADSPTAPLRVRYTNARTGEAITTDRVDHRLRGLIEYFAHDPTPEAPAPGLAMTYSEVVGALYELAVRQRVVNATFYAEQDLLQAEVLASARSSLGAPRAELAGETEGPADESESTASATETPLAPPTSGPPRRPTYVVPISPPPGSAAGEEAPAPKAAPKPKGEAAGPAPTPTPPDRPE